MRKRTMRVLLTALLVVLCAAISLGVYVWSIFQPAHVDVTCSGDNEGRLIINARRSWNVDRLELSVRLADVDEDMWVVRPTTGRAWSMAYGQETDELVQEYPPRGTPVRNIPPGSVFRIVLHWRLRNCTVLGGYDVFWFWMSEAGVPTAIAPPRAETEAEDAVIEDVE